MLRRQREFLHRSLDAKHQARANDSQQEQRSLRPVELAKGIQNVGIKATGRDRTSQGRPSQG